MLHHDNMKKVYSKWSALWLLMFLLACWRLVMIIFRHIPLDYNEGWNGVLASWAASGTYNLYSPGLGFVFNNYPPLSFVLLGGVKYLGGDAIIFGRLLSFVSVLVISYLIYRIVRVTTERATPALAISCAFLATASMAFYRYFGMDDPQWFAQCLMLSGAYVLIGDGTQRFGWKRLFASALLIVLGGFTKHNIVALPLSVFVWLLFVNKIRALYWSLSVSIFLLLGFGICYEMYGVNFFQSIFLHKRVITLHRVFHGLQALPLMGGMLILGIGIFFREKKNISRSNVFVWAFIYLVFSLFLGEIEALGKGVDYNCMFDALVACSILCGIGLVYLGARETKQQKMNKLCLVISLPLLALAPFRGEIFYQGVQSTIEEDKIWKQNIALLEEYKTSLMCTDMALCYWAGSLNGIDNFNLSQALLKHKDDFLVRGLISQRKIAFVQVFGSLQEYGSGNSVLDGWLKDAGYQPHREIGHKLVLLTLHK